MNQTVCLPLNRTSSLPRAELVRHLFTDQLWNAGPDDIPEPSSGASYNCCIC